MLDYTIYQVKIKYITPLLGLNPSDNLAQEYLVSKAKKELEKLEKKRERLKNEEEIEIIEKEIERLKTDLEIKEEINLESLRPTKLPLKIFARDKEGNFSLYHYQIKGHLKEVAAYFFSGLKLKNAISRYVDILPANVTLKDVEEDWVKGYYIPLARNGEYVKEADDILVRPLRSFVAGQYIVTINQSEILYPPLETAFQIVCWDNRIEETIFKELLEKGEIWGHSEWRTARYGRFKIIEFSKINEIKRRKIKL